MSDTQIGRAVATQNQNYRKTRIATIGPSMRTTLLLAYVASCAGSIGDHTTGIVAPLASVIDCEDGRLSDADCGPAVAHRTQFNNDWCARLDLVMNGTLTLSTALEGAVLDILLLPKEDETLWIEPADGDKYFGGIVGEALNYMAAEVRLAERAGRARARPRPRPVHPGFRLPHAWLFFSRTKPCTRARVRAHTKAQHLFFQGGYTWNAIIAEPPGPDDAYGGDWNLWMLDWVNRVDFIAAWMYDKPSRRDAGIMFPHSFYDLSPLLLVVETISKVPPSALLHPARVLIACVRATALPPGRRPSPS